MGIQAWATKLSAALFLPVRRLTGWSHRSRPALSDEQLEHQQSAQQLPPPWRDDPRWYGLDFLPSGHNAITPLAHGEQYFADVYQGLREARSRVTICGWCLTPLMPLLRGDDEASSILADVLRSTSDRAEVRILLWAGAPALFEPTVHQVEHTRRTLLEIAPRVRCELDRTAPFSHDHHQKAITIDGRVAYVGGMDLSTFQGDRWDTLRHPLRLGPGWHDVQARLEGEVVRDVEENFCQRWYAVTGERLDVLPRETIDSTGDMPAQIVRTIPAGIYGFAPKGIFGIYHALISAIEHAQHFVYLENQYLWAPEIVDALISAMEQRRDRPFRIVVVLPAAAYDGRYDNDQHIRALKKADGGRGIFAAYTLVAGGPAWGLTGYGYVPIYVHAKVCIVDDEWLSIGSANLNRRGLSTDSEMNVQAVAAETARDLRVHLWTEHLGLQREDVERLDPVDLIDREWKGVSKRLLHAYRDSARPTGGQIVPYLPGSNPINRMLDRIQDLTLEH